MHDPTVCNALIAKIPFYADKEDLFNWEVCQQLVYSADTKRRKEFLAWPEFIYIQEVEQNHWSCDTAATNGEACVWRMAGRPPEAMRKMVE